MNDMLITNSLVVKKRKKNKNLCSIAKYVQDFHLFCSETLCLIFSLPIFPLLLSCVSLSRPQSVRCFLILEYAARLPAGIGGLSDHLFHTAFPHSLGEPQASVAGGVFLFRDLPLCYIPSLPFSPIVLQLLII